MQKSRAPSKKKSEAKQHVEPSAAVVVDADEKKKRGRKKNVEPPVVSKPEPEPEPESEPKPEPAVQQEQAPSSTLVAKKRTSKKKVPLVQTPEAVEAVPPVASASTDTSSSMAHKKRGRKPKGGKVIQQLSNESVAMNDAPNIILHLKCSVSDIPSLNASFAETSVKPGDVISFNALESKGADLNDLYQSNVSSVGNFVISSNSNTAANAKPRTTPDALIAINSYNHLNDADYDNNDDDEMNNGENNLKDIWKKLNHLKLCFHKSDVFQNIGAGTRRSCCFWDTCEFDTPPIYIPKCIAPNGGYTVYGCFCSPECAVAYLMNEGIDTSVKFERCQMLNSMYGRALNYDKSIKPAPNPQYILNKFYGNLSIQEYRKLFKSEQIIYVVNKPLTHILPEMYEDNNDFLLNNKVIPNNNYKLKKKTSAFG